MLMQNLRGRVGSRLSGNSEAGFTLVELLVVMLILGILAAIAIPAFFNQKSKANDSQAKAVAHSSQVAMETCATDNNGTYTNCDLRALQAIEPTIPTTGTAINGRAPVGGYTIDITAANTRNVFTITRALNGGVTYRCITAGTGGCPVGGNWGQ
jgi:type IV pilus assembly protein PilA